MATFWTSGSKRLYDSLSLEGIHPQTKRGILMSEEIEEENTEIMYKPPGRSEHYPLDKVLDNIYHRIELLEKSLDSIFNLPT